MKINFSRKRRDPAREGQMRVRYAPGKRTLANLKWRLTLLIVLSPFLYFLGKVIFSLFIAPSSGFVMLESLRYQSPANGEIQVLSVAIGQEVEAGDQLMIIKDFELEKKIKEIRARIEEIQQTEIQDTATGKYLADQVEIARQALEHQQKKYEDVDFLFRQGAATLAEHNTAVNQLNGVKSSLMSREFEYRQWLEQSITQTTKSRQDASIGPLQSTLNNLQEDQERLQVQALHPGRITEIFVTQGQLVKRAEQTMAIARRGKATIIAYVEPKRINRIQSGEVADIELPSGQKIRGLVQYNPGVTGRLPSYLSTPMLGRQRMIVVYLTPIDDLPQSEIVDGLPVKVHFLTPAKQLLNRVIGLFS